MWHNEIFKCVGDAQGGGGELWISIDRDDHRVFWGLKSPVQGFFLVGKFGKYFCG